MSKGGQVEMNSSLVEDSSEEHATLMTQDNMDPNGPLVIPQKGTNRHSVIYENNLHACTHLMDQKKISDSVLAEKSRQFQSHAANRTF